ncbi:hypothetical protein [Hymenobacter negativus]|uniref:Uncharacterized protein n=1 Tax=Hymenobacter negativus TaxID=2795026 RepID=A0ABS3QKA6_9BACT|nr:hypothetical protein [Hymenobacter negativus]MBO2011682.1 hypothetical protein [Hymenobacter negativus]
MFTLLLQGPTLPEMVRRLHLQAHRRNPKPLPAPCGSIAQYSLAFIDQKLALEAQMVALARF